jgi:hypothetical protein
LLENVDEHKEHSTFKVFAETFFTASSDESTISDESASFEPSLNVKSTTFDSSTFDKSAFAGDSLIESSFVILTSVVASPSCDFSLL